MKRKNIHDAARAGAVGTRAGRMSHEELRTIMEILNSGAAVDAVLLAYNAGYYRGAVAATHGQYDPNQGSKKKTGGRTNA